MNWIRLEWNEFVHIEHNNNEYDTMQFNDAAETVILERAAFHYDPKMYSGADKSVTVGEMTIMCQYCKALNTAVNLLDYVVLVER